MPDKAFDLAIVDPPYGYAKWKKNTSRGSSRILKYGSVAFNASPIDEFYIIELQRVSRHQIIFGANYFPQLLPPSQGWIFWHKDNPVHNFADGEFAYTNFDKPAKYFGHRYFGNLNVDTGGRIHPTQKPVALYKWILTNYAKPGDKILDTHLGSGSSRIAAWDLGFDFTGYELDPDYFREGNERFERHRAQGNLFTPDDAPKPTQGGLFG